MAEREASRDFDYLLDDVADGDDALAPAFDAFDADTWYFEPAPPPWYRTGQSLSVLVVAGVAAVALVTSGVLLAFRGPSTTAVDDVTSATPTAPTTVATIADMSSAPPRPLPPPAAEPTAPATVPASAPAVRPRSPSTRTTKEPEINVTRTPVTRSPLSVAPQRPGGDR